MFITFEGIDGVGKSTQIELLSRWMRGHVGSGKKIISTRLPGGTPLGEKIRSIVKYENIPISPKAELFMMMVTHCDVVNQVIDPNLKDGNIVICDRYSDSTLAYQCGGRQLPEQLVRSLIEMACGKTIPDVTFLITVPDEEVMSRLSKTAPSFDRFESEVQAFRDRVKWMYARLAAEEPNRVILVDGSGSVEQVHERIKLLMAAKIFVDMDESR